MQDIEHELKEHEKSLFSVAQKYRALARDAATKRVIYDVAWANAMESITATALESGEKVTDKVKEAKATVIVQLEMSECRMAEADLDAAKKYIDVMQAMLSSVQTRAKLSQMEMALAR